MGHNGGKSKAMQGGQNIGLGSFAHEQTVCLALWEEPEYDTGRRENRERTTRRYSRKTVGGKIYLP